VELVHLVGFIKKKYLGIYIYIYIIYIIYYIYRVSQEERT